MRRFLSLLLTLWFPSVHATSKQLESECDSALASGARVVEYNGMTFEVTSLSSDEFIRLTPRPRLHAGFDTRGAIAADLDTVWDLQHFKVPHRPEFLEALGDPAAFDHAANLRILDMPIKMRGSNEYRLPMELAQFAPALRQIIDHEHAMLDDATIADYHAYLTIDQAWVGAEAFQRTPGNHVDGFQGGRITTKTRINHSYLIMNATPTVFYPQAFDFDALDENAHDFFKEMDRVADPSRAIEAPLHRVVLIDAYTVHRAARSSRAHYRTFLRLSYDPKEFDRLGNTKNPHFDYDWDMQIRNVHASLSEYKPVEQCRACGGCARGRAMRSADLTSEANVRIPRPDGRAVHD